MSMANMWGDKVAEAGFARVPLRLSQFRAELGLSYEEYSIIVWLIYFQHDLRPCFPHDQKIAEIFGLTIHELNEMWSSLKDRGLLATELTQKGDNHYKDLKPLFLRLRQLVESKSEEDLSIKRSTLTKDRSTLIDKSISEAESNKGMAALKDVVAKRRKE